MGGEYDVGAAELRELAGKLSDLLQIRTLPIGMKQFENLEEMQEIKGLRMQAEGRKHTACQLVTQSWIAGFTLGVTAVNVRGQSNCGGVMGIDMPDEGTLSGEHMTGVWFENQEAAKAHQDGMTRQVHGKFIGTVCSPLRSARLDPPVCEWPAVETLQAIRHVDHRRECVFRQLGQGTAHQRDVDFKSLLCRAPLRRRRR